jgi:hypothetical protein
MTLAIRYYLEKKNNARIGKRMTFCINGITSLFYRPAKQNDPGKLL